MEFFIYMFLLLRLSESLLEQARKRKAEDEEAANQEPGGIREDEEAGALPHATLLERVQKILQDIGQLKSWMLRSMMLCVNEPEVATQQLLQLVANLTDQNPAFSSVAEELGLSDSVFGTDVDLASLGVKLEDLEKRHLEIQKDLEKAGPAKKRRGRPFGSKNKPRKAAEEDLEGGPLLTPPRKVRRRKEPAARGKSKPDAPVGEDGEAAGGAEVEAEPPEGTDPFAELEERSPNKSTTISLHSKCLVVEFAKSLHESGTCHNIEKEVMGRFPKYFWSHEAGRWKSGLLTKWKKLLVSKDSVLSLLPTISSF